MMVIWACLTMVTASTHSPQAIMAIRFFQGMAEASTFVGTHYILGSWYKERELGKRSGIFTASGLAGTMIGGFIQSGIYTSMDGRHGLRGWRWLFIIDGIVTLPVALYGFLLFPDTPATTTAPYLSPAERQLAISRVPPTDSHLFEPQPEHDATTNSPHEANNKPRPTSPLTWTFAKRVLTSYEWWGFVILWVIAGETESFSSNSLLALFMKSSPRSSSSTPYYTVSQLNDYPTGVPAVGIVSTLFWAALTDFLGGKRYLVGYFIGVTGVATSAMILAAQKSMDPGGERATAVVFGAYYWAGAVYACQATFFAWANDAMRHQEPVFRSVVLAGMNLGNNAVNAWWSIVFYGASMAPWFEVSSSAFYSVFVTPRKGSADRWAQRGMYAMIATSVALAIWTAGLSYVTSRAEKQRRLVASQENPSREEAGSAGEVGETEKSG
jgi:ACS family pantothenate transporter-like MFS transporter